LLGLLLGLVAVMITPREEEPQIDVTMANVTVPFPGAPVDDVENLISVSAGAECCPRSTASSTSTRYLGPVCR
jgi:hypothetical protein